MAKANTIGNRKTFALADHLDVEPWAALGLMEALWDWASEQATTGDLACCPVSMIAEGVKWRGKPKDLLHALRLHGWVDELPGGILYIHDWHEHAQDRVRKKLERSGKTFANGFPARLPKDGYAAAGYVSPEPLPYRPNDETPSRQNHTPTPKTARQRRDAVSPKVPPSDGFGEPRARVAHPIPSKPYQTGEETDSQVPTAAAGDGPTDGAPPGSTSLSEPEEPGDPGAKPGELPVKPDQVMSRLNGFAGKRIPPDPDEDVRQAEERRRELFRQAGRTL